MNVCSSLNRNLILGKLAEDTFDLCVIGGGVTGAGIALDAASRGLKVALVEKNDFASGTSSKSTKLIHGGLRYLKQLEIGLVREVGQERAIVHDLAPHLVIPEKMLLPLIKDGTLGKFSTSVALLVYDFLAGVEGDDKRKMLTAEETLNLEPLLKKEVIVGGGIYAEYRTDDARLTIELVKTAARFGAISINYVKAEDFIYENGKVRGIIAKNMLLEETLHIHSKYVISAAGPWVDKLRAKNKSLSDKHLFPTKGVHIVVPHKKFPLQHSVYFDVKDGRMIFAIPRQRVTYIGTTDTPYKGDINHVLTKMEDVDYLVEAVNNMFPTVSLSSSDVISSWAGLRPLIYEEGKSVSELSRKDEIFISDTDLISIAGGKLTGYRKMAQRTVNEVIKRMEAAEDIDIRDSYTRNIPLLEKPFKDVKAVENYKESLKNQVIELGLPAFCTQYLVANYGNQSDLILGKMKDFENTPLIALTRAELWYSVHHELVFSLQDFFIRRTGRLYFNIDLIEPFLHIIAEDLKNYLNWNEKRSLQEIQWMQQELLEVSQFEYSKDVKEKKVRV